MPASPIRTWWGSSAPSPAQVLGARLAQLHHHYGTKDGLTRLFAVMGLDDKVFNPVQLNGIP